MTASSDPQARYQERMRSNMSALALKERLIAQELATVTEALQGFADSDDLATAAGVIVSSTTRYVLGGGTSYGYATLLATTLTTGLSKVLLMDGFVVRPLDALSDTHGTDSLTVFSFRRYLPEPITVARAFKGLGGRVVAVTDSRDAPIGEFADVIIEVPTESASFIDSPTAVAAAAHILATLALAGAKGTRRRLATRARVAADLGLYWR